MPLIDMSRTGGVDTVDQVGTIPRSICELHYHPYVLVVAHTPFVPDEADEYEIQQCEYAVVRHVVDGAWVEGHHAMDPTRKGLIPLSFVSVALALVTDRRANVVMPFKAEAADEVQLKVLIGLPGLSGPYRQQLTDGSFL